MSSQFLRQKTAAKFDWRTTRAVSGLRSLTIQFAKSILVATSSAFSSFGKKPGVSRLTFSPGASYCPANKNKRITNFAALFHHHGARKCLKEFISLALE